MNTLLEADRGTVPRKRKDQGGRKPAIPRDRFDLRVEPEWFARINRQAERLGISASAYIRQAATRQLEIDEASDPKKV